MFIYRIYYIILIYIYIPLKIYKTKLKPSCLHEVSIRTKKSPGFIQFNFIFLSSSWTLSLSSSSRVSGLWFVFSLSERLSPSSSSPETKQTCSETDGDSSSHQVKRGAHLFVHLGFLTLLLLLLLLFFILLLILLLWGWRLLVLQESRNLRRQHTCSHLSANHNAAGSLTASFKLQTRQKYFLFYLIWTL